MMKELTPQSSADQPEVPAWKIAAGAHKQKKATKKKSLINMTADELLEEGPSILKNADAGPIFARNLKKDLPSFDLNELTLGKILGHGAFGIVKEITVLNPSKQTSKKGLDAQATLSTGKADDSKKLLHDCVDHSDITVENLRAQMAIRCLRNGEARYAIKYLRQKYLCEKSKVEGRIDLALEIKFLQVLNHPNIIKIRGVKNTDLPLDKSNFFVMDKLYDTLETRLTQWGQRKQRLKGGPLHFFKTRQQEDKQDLHDLLVERLIVAYDLATAFCYLHENGMVYRDIKPENCGFDVRGDIKLFDFGLAKSLLPSLKDKSDSKLYNLTGRTGTFPYMAPEVAKCRPYNESCDVFGFGILFWKILALRDPFPCLKTRKEYYDKVACLGVRPRIRKHWPERSRKVVEGAFSENRPSFDVVAREIRADLNNSTNKIAVQSRTQHRLNLSVHSLGDSISKRFRTNRVGAG